MVVHYNYKDVDYNFLRNEYQLFSVSKSTPKFCLLVESEDEGHEKAKAAIDFWIKNKNSV